MLALVLDAPDPTRFTEQLLDKGFATPVAAEAGDDVMPPIVPGAGAAGADTAAVRTAAPPSPPATHVTHPVHRASSAWLPPTALGVGSGLLLAIVARRRQVRARRRRRRAALRSP